MFIKEKACLNVQTGKVETLIFLHINYINKYNNEMGGSGIADNLSNYYRIYFWARKRKWWWHIFFWGVGVILRDACIIYIFIHYIHGNPSKYRLFHHYFRKAISCAWITQKNTVQSNLNSSQKSHIFEEK